MPGKLHIGGKISLPGWEVLNVISEPYVDHVGDAKDLSRFESNTFSIVYASHVPDHFDFINELGAVLSEWKSVLIPGGNLYVSVPDLDAFAQCSGPFLCTPF